MPPLRRAAVVGAGSWGTALAVALARAGLDVELGCRTRRAGRRDRAPPRERPLPARRAAAGRGLGPSGRRARPRPAPTSSCLAVPARDLPAALAEHGARDPRARRRAGRVQGPRAAAGHAARPRTSPSACARRGVGVPRRPGPRRRRARTRRLRSCVASADGAFARQLADVLDTRRLRRAPHERRRPASSSPAAPRTPPRWPRPPPRPAGPNAAGAAAGKVFAEVDALARRRGARPETFAGLAGDGRPRRHRRGRRQPQPPCRRAARRRGARRRDRAALGQTAEAVDAVPLLADALREARRRRPGRRRPRRLVEGRVEPGTLGGRHHARPRDGPQARAA